MLGTKPRGVAFIKHKNKNQLTMLKNLEIGYSRCSLHLGFDLKPCFLLVAMPYNLPILANKKAGPDVKPISSSSSSNNSHQR